jgi:hypothetical protein
MRRRVALLAAATLALGPSPGAVASEPSAEDLASIEAMASQGIDLAEPHELEFLLSFPRIEAAREAGKVLSKEGYTGKIQARRGGKDALLFARKRVTLDAQTLGELRERFDALAAAGGGRYEGWGLP